MIERLILSVCSGNSYRHMIEQASANPNQILIFNRLRHVEIHSIEDEEDTELKTLSIFLKMLHQRYSLKFLSS